MHAAGNRTRELVDRRRRPTPILSRYWLSGRRRGGRRHGESAGNYVDRYTGSEWARVGLLLLLSLMDLVLTAVHLAAGGTEANPVMAWLLDVGGMPGFVGAKLLLTIFGATVLLVHVRFRGVRRVLTLAVLVYACVLAWHGVIAFLRV